MHRFEELGARHSHCSRWFSTISSLVGTPDRRTVFSSIHILVLYTSIRYALCPLFVVIILSHSLYITERYFLWVMKFMFCAALHSLAISTIQHLFGQHIAHYPTKSKRNKSVRNHSRKHEIEKKKKKLKLLWFGSTLWTKIKWILLILLCLFTSSTYRLSCFVRCKGYTWNGLLEPVCRITATIKAHEKA